MEIKRMRPRNVDGNVRDAEELGQFIRKRRKELGMTQVELSKFCKCSPRFIGELERGIAGGNIKQVLKVVHMLGMDLFIRTRGE